MKTPYLSICIPTNGRLEIIKKTLDSIYDKKNQVDLSDFEVVISDNAKNDDLLTVLEFFKQYDNIAYFKADCEGFLNSVNALKCGKGMFLKLHNNHSVVTPLFLKETIDFIKKNKENKPQVFFSNKVLIEDEFLEFDNFDSFMFKLTYFNTWSSGFSIWREDFENIPSNISLDNFFPQNSLLMELSKKNKYYINNKQYFFGQEIPRKGGYNIFKAFAVNYLDILLDGTKNNIISKKTYLKIKRDIINIFLIEWYYSLKIIKIDHTFDLSGIKESIEKHYSTPIYYMFIIHSYIYALKRFFINNIKYLIRKT